MTSEQHVHLVFSGGDLHFELWDGLGGVGQGGSGTSLAYLVTPTYRRFVVVQDTGAASKGARADLFLGAGADAGRVAGRTKERGRLYVLNPRS